MKILASEKLSTHKYIDNSGYLICTDAVLARTGKQEYLKSEIYAGCTDNTIIEVDRKPEQVFATATLASFENKPLTCEHPYENVTPDNYGQYAVGYVRNIRKGTHNGQDVIIGDIVVTNKQCIEDIQNGIRTDLSCGYDCDITDGDNPEQINIRGNHVALCEQGRAGIAKIIDTAKLPKSQVKDETRSNYIIWLKDADENWYVWDKTDSEQLPDNWLSDFNTKNNSKYIAVKVVKNGETITDSCQDILPIKYTKLDKADKKTINTILKNYNGKATYDIDIIDIMDDLKEAGFEVYNVSAEAEGQGYQNLYDKNYLLEVVKGDKKSYIQINFYRDKDFVTKEVNSYITDKLPREIKKMKDSQKYVIYKNNNELMGTDLDNYNAKNQNAKNIKNWSKDGFKTVEQIIEHLIENNNINREDILVKNEEAANLTDEAFNFVERYRGVQITLESGKYIGSYMKHDYSCDTLDEIKAKIDADKTRQAELIKNETLKLKMPVYENPKDVMKDSLGMPYSVEWKIGSKVYQEKFPDLGKANVKFDQVKDELLENNGDYVEIWNLNTNKLLKSHDFEIIIKLYDAVSKIDGESNKYNIHFTGTYNDCVKYIDKKFEVGTDRIWDIVARDSEYSKRFYKELNEQQNIARANLEKEIPDNVLDGEDDTNLKITRNKLRKHLKEQAKLSKEKYEEME